MLAIIFNNVDLPIPLGPMIPTFSPLYIFKFTFLNISRELNEIEISSAFNTSLPLFILGENFNTSFLLFEVGLSTFRILSKAFCRLKACLILRLLP